MTVQNGPTLWRRLARVTARVAAMGALGLATTAGLPSGPASAAELTFYRVAFQGSDGFLYTADHFGVIRNTSLRMAPGTSPAARTWCISATTCPATVAFQANDGILWLYEARFGGARSTGQAMRAGTSPSITATVNGVAVVAFQGRNGTLWRYTEGVDAVDTHQPMAAGTSPSISDPPPPFDTGGPVIAYQTSGGVLATLTPDNVPHVTGLGMAPRTSPNITEVHDGRSFPRAVTVKIAFQATNNVLWTVDTHGTGHPTSFTMSPGSNPSIARQNIVDADDTENVQIAIRANTSALWLIDPHFNSGRSWTLGLATNTSPSVMLVRLLDDTGGNTIVFQSTDGKLSIIAPDGTLIATGSAMMAGTSPVIFGM
jgi:hypothetical protein